MSKDEWITQISKYFEIITLTDRTDTMLLFATSKVYDDSIS